MMPELAADLIAVTFCCTDLTNPCCPLLHLLPSTPPCPSNLSDGDDARVGGGLDGSDLLQHCAGKGLLSGRLLVGQVGDAGQRSLQAAAQTARPRKVRQSRLAHGWCGWYEWYGRAANAQLAGSVWTIKLDTFCWLCTYVNLRLLLQGL